MASSKIRKGDNVIVITGSDKNKMGTVMHVRTSDSKILVSGVNVFKKSNKNNDTPNSNFLEKEAYIHISNVAHFDPVTNKPSKVGFKQDESGKVRVFKKSGNKIKKNNS